MMTYKTCLVLLFLVSTTKSCDSCVVDSNFRLKVIINNLQGQVYRFSLYKPSDSLILQNDVNNKTIASFDIEKNVPYLCEFVSDFMELEEKYVNPMIGGQMVTIQLYKQQDLVKEVVFENYESEPVERLDSLFFKPNGIPIYW